MSGGIVEITWSLFVIDNNCHEIAGNVINRHRIRHDRARVCLIKIQLRSGCHFSITQCSSRRILGDGRFAVDAMKIEMFIHFSLDSGDGSGVAKRGAIQSNDCIEKLCNYGGRARVLDSLHKMIMCVCMCFSMCHTRLNTDAMHFRFKSNIFMNAWQFPFPKAS